MSAALATARVSDAGSAGGAELEPFFQMTDQPARSRLRSILRFWPLVVFLVVLLFFAIAGLAAE